MEYRYYFALENFALFFYFCERCELFFAIIFIKLSKNVWKFHNEFLKICQKNLSKFRKQKTSRNFEKKLLKISQNIVSKFHKKTYQNIVSKFHKKRFKISEKKLLKIFGKPPKILFSI